MNHYVLDIGNSRIKGAAFSDETLIDGSFRFFAHGEWPEIYRELTNHNARRLLYSTVANVPPSILLHKLRAEGRAIFQLDHSSPLPFRNDYKSPTTLGKDRLAALSGAAVLDASANFLVVDAGTCMTLDLLTAEGVYPGGIISPGVRMRLRAMHEGTARLPLVETAVELQPLLGKTTEEALRAGGQYGAANEVSGLFQRLEAAYQPLRLVLTGGDAELISAHLTIDHEVIPHLVLLGLNKILTLYAD